MMTIDDAVATILSEESRIAERRIDVNQLTVESDMLCVGDQRLRFEEKGLSRLCDRFDHQPKVPAQYVNSLPDSLRTALLRHHLASGFQGEGAVSLFARDSELIGIGNPHLARLSGQEVLDAVIAGAGGRDDGLEIARLEIDDETFQMDLVVRHSSRDVQRGDPVLAGVHVGHSLIGVEATRIEGFVYRLACTNGLKVRECVGPRQAPRTRRLPENHPNARVLQQEQVRRLVEEAVGMLNRRFDGLERLTTEPMDLDHFASGWLRRSRLSPARLMPLLRQAHLEEGGEPTAYGVLNAFTRVATHRTELSRNIRNALARMGGLLAFGHSRMCPKCWALVTAGN